MLPRAGAPWTLRGVEALATSTALLFLAVASGGCATAGLAAAGPLFTAIQALTDRSVERTLPLDLQGASAATVDTIARLGFQVRDLRRGEEAWTFQAVSEALTVHGRLTPVAPALTRLSLRVEAGTFSADKGTADEIHNQIAASLADQGAKRASTAVDGAESRALSALEVELRRLRLEFEGSRTRASDTPGRADGDARSGSGVISIPASYGVPTVSPASAPPDPRHQAESSRPDRSGSGLDDTPSTSVLARPLTPARALSPIQPMTETGSGGK